MNLSILDGRTELWQWDTGIRLVMDEACEAVNISASTFGVSVDVTAAEDGKTWVATVPDEMLQVPGDLICYAVQSTDTGAITAAYRSFRVNRRPKPYGYVATPTEARTWKELDDKKIDAPQTAAVGEVLTVEEIGEDGKPTKWKAVDMPEQVQANWNQNDSTQPDYVKNRTHYTNKDTVLEYGMLSGFEDDGSGVYVCVLPYVLDIYDGLKVEVTWDNQVYRLTATQPHEYYIFIGNNAFSDGEDTGEPFAIMINKLEGITLVGSTDTETSHEVGIVAESPVRIEPYFLPSNIAYLQNGFIPLNLVIPSAEGIFGGPIYAGGTESTLENPYPNKHTLNKLTLETFNKMLVGTVYLPGSVLVDGKNIASVSVYKNDGYIRVLWSGYNTHTIPGYTLAGARIEIYDAKIHEDAGNPGTIVSEYAKITVANKQLT